MEHQHTVEDHDPGFFIIDTDTRAIYPQSEEGDTLCLVQGDHNSEVYEFNMPLYVEGHDMSLCDKIRINYLNISKNGSSKYSGVYEVSNPTRSESASEGDTLSFFWPISLNATQFEGTLNFSIRFYCFAEDGSVDYTWSTAIYSGIPVLATYDHGEEVVKIHADVLMEWERELDAKRIISFSQTTTSDESDGINVWTATFANGETASFTVRNGSQGEPGNFADAPMTDGSGKNSLILNDNSSDSSTRAKGDYSIVAGIGTQTGRTNGYIERNKRYYANDLRVDIINLHVPEGEDTRVMGDLVVVFPECITGTVYLESGTPITYEYVWYGSTYSGTISEGASIVDGYYYIPNQSGTWGDTYAYDSCKITNDSTVSILVTYQDRQGRASIAIGEGTIAASDVQLAAGKYNIEDTNDMYACILGNGSSDTARSNALTVDWDGNIVSGGTLTLGDTILTEDDIKALKPIKSDGTLTLGDTTLTEEQLKILVSIKSSEEVTF